MPFLRRFCVLLCCAAMLITLVIPVQAQETDDPQELIQQMLCYYHHHQSAGKTDVYRLLAQLEEIDPEAADLWRDIFDYWFYATEELPRNNTTLPEDLPEDNSLCIVVLGYSLTETGSMKPELIGRLELALSAAEQYPNAYILCTGGGTAPDAPNVTEAGQMARWLRQNGIDSERIIVESRSTHTIENAKYVFDIFDASYPEIRSLVIVTSDYHLPRSTTLFYAKAAQTGRENDNAPITIAAVLGYDADHEGIAEDPLDQTAHLARVMGFEYGRGEEPSLSRLVELTAIAEPVTEVGQMPALIVTAHYDTGFSRDVTADCTVADYDPTGARTQSITVTYAENGRQISTFLDIRRPGEPTEPSTQPIPTEIPTEPTPAPEAPEKKETGFPFLLLLCALALPSQLAAKRRRR